MSFGDAIRRSARLTAALMRASADGVAIATTPKSERWRDGKVSLHRYREPGAPRLGPLLIVHGLIGRQTITDLEPERSLVCRLIEAGVDLWVIDWGSPSRADAGLCTADYAIDWLGEAIDVIRAETGAPAVALFGICQGGVFALCQAALAPDRVAGLALAVTPVDFHADMAGPPDEQGLLNLWARGLDRGVLEAFLEERGVLPGALTGAVFQSLAPERTLAKYGPDLLGMADDAPALETFLRMEAWLSDRPDLPSGVAREWLVDLYGENALVEGQFALDGRPVRLGAISCPVLNIVAAADHIVPPPCSLALAGAVGGPYRLVEVAVGHIGVFVSARARSVVAPALVGWLAEVDGLGRLGAGARGQR